MTVDRPLFFYPRLALAFATVAAATLVYCGGGSSPTGGNPTPVPTVAPSATPTPLTSICSPTPPPLYGIAVKIHDDSGFRKILDSRPRVVNSYDTVPSYCEIVDQGNGPFCFTRTEGGDQQLFACDSLAVGKALDTGRAGPTWYFNGLPCTAEGDSANGCRNHPDNQFLVIAKGPGEYAACANPSVKVAPTGSNCGVFVVK